MTPTPLPVTKIRSRAQLVFCQGCCCGRTDRGHPELPVERLKAAWKAAGLNKTVQLTVSGCLGPCDRTNVTLALLPGGGQAWFGGLGAADDYARLIAWAEACHAARAVLPLPDWLAAHRFERWPTLTPVEVAT